MKSLFSSLSLWFSIKAFSQNSEQALDRFMKILLLFLFQLISFPVFSQLILDLDSMPSGYYPIDRRERNDIEIDNTGNYWLAFNRIGIGKFDGSVWTMYDTLNGSLESNQVYSITLNNSGNILAGTKAGLSIFNGSIWIQFNHFNSPLPSSGVKTIESYGSILWAGTDSGVYTYDGANWTVYNTSNSGISGNSVNCIAVGNNGEIIVGTTEGLSVLYQGIWVNYSSSNSNLFSDTINDVAVNANNQIWLNTLGRTYFLNSLTNSFTSIKNLIPGPEQGCIQLPDSINRTIESVNGDIYFIIDNPNIYYGDQYTKLLYKVTPSHAITFEKIMNLKIPYRFIAFKLRNNKIGFTGYASTYTYLYSTDTSQFTFEEMESSFYEYSNLNINKVNARILNRGDMHWDPIYQVSMYNTPACSQTNSVYASALWVGGLDGQNQLHIAAHTYRQENSIDFWPGPLDTISGTIDSLTVNQYDRLWKVNKSTIDNFIYNYGQGNVTSGSYEIPEVIQNWPAHGTGNNSRMLAPYVDKNNDGVYNPLNGDYPCISGDQELWWIFNDAYGQHTETGGLPLNLEIHGKAYAFHRVDNSMPEAIEYTTFYQFTFINRSNNIYHDIYTGIRSDIDLGNAADDYIGCDVGLNAAIAYNADSIDEGAAGYGSHPPFQDIIILKGPLADPFDGIDNNKNGAIDEMGETIGMSGFRHMRKGNSGDPTGTPHIADDFYEYLTSRWLDGLPVTYGENGRNQNNPTCNYMYPGLTDTSFTQLWTMPSAGIAGDEMRMMPICGKFSLQPGESRTLDFAFVFSRDTIGSWPSDAEAKNLADIQTVIDWFNNNVNTSCQRISNNVAMDTEDLLIYPNPASSEIKLNRSVSGNYIYTIYDMLGKACAESVYNSDIIDINFLVGGLYFITLRNSEISLSGKFAKL